MGKKRSREIDGQGDVPMADPAVDKKGEDDSSDDEVRTKNSHRARALAALRLTFDSRLP